MRRRLDTGAVVSWLSEGAEIRETKDESGKLTRQEFHQRTASLTTFTVTTVTTTTASNTSSDSRSTVGVEVNMTERSSAGSSGFILDASSTESHNIAQPETKADDELLLSQQQQCPLQVITSTSLFSCRHQKITHLGFLTDFPVRSTFPYLK